MAALPPSACRGGIGAGRCSRHHVQVKVLPLPSLALTALSTTPSLKLRAARRRTRWGWTACSTSFPRLGRVGWHRREGSASLLSFGAAPGELLAGGGGNQASDDLSQALSALLPFVVAATAVSALVNPATFSWPLALSVGYIAQYALKPLLGLLIAKAFRTPTMFYAGFILTCCVAGAQLSSYASFLSKSDVALSILLTSSTTISSVLVTPLLTGLLIGSVVPVDGVAMSKSILQVVLFPVALGLLLNTYAKPFVNLIRPIMPFIAMFCTSLCIGSPLSINRSQILSSNGLMLLFPIITFHLVAFMVGYWFAKLPMLRQEESACRTISLCTGMQSSTLAGLLATQFLGGSHAVPAACSVVVMAIMGLSLASFWGTGYRIRDIPLLVLPDS
ncbi:probable sodium/metabolite cotransporter BASS3, chloroplastic isoform X3 [Zingiber officinale]|uniref:probable sodium/metabolite cotransporter BASS3, chloroplastic isoform X3 n=1 Tax=Zingiber officinale TaxID=94328 RepID=UPI001C4DBEC9|nr:probable sodium/metabolite cotransporter BASS3, chloroplastic isoform X3 [Zingiber officinale]XP_042438844.1 probable sodium/metabolite cotransporter BASS3, chloroplastic isoform X3 [Zingiber officinale]